MWLENTGAIRRHENMHVNMARREFPINANDFSPTRDRLQASCCATGHMPAANAALPRL
jgi:hypothetical protein